MEIRNDYISVREFAKMVGVKHPAIVSAMDKGWIKDGIYIHPANNHRKILPDIAKKEWDKFQAETGDKDFLREAGRKRGRKIADKRGEGKSDSSTLVSFKKQEAKVNLQMKLINLRKLKGELVEKQVVYDELFEFGKLLRDTIMVIPDRIIDQLIAAKSRNEAHIILTEALEDSLRGLAEAGNLKFTDENQ